MICPRYAVVGVMEQFQTSLAVLQVLQNINCRVQLTHPVQVMLFKENNVIHDYNVSGNPPPMVPRSNQK